MVAHILLARCFWRSRIWLRSRLASWAAVPGLAMGTACTRAGDGWGLAVLQELDWPGSSTRGEAG